jgi:hypothetical protein
MARHFLAVSSLCAAGLLCGCASETHSTERLVTASPAQRSLILPSPAMLDAALEAPADWEYARNDRLLGSPPRELPALDEYGETVTYDWRWTINGRPREFSNTFSYSVQQRTGP